MPLSAFRQETFTSSLAAACERGPTSLGAHPGAEAMLAFPGPFRGLVSAFHQGIGGRLERLR